jgi:microcystin-dependent protein
MYGGATAPSGYLECNGAAVSRSTYSALFTAIGSTYGSGDGSTTFNLPDLRGEFVRGWDHGKGTDSGRVRGSNQSGAIESHTHTLHVYDRADTDSLGSGGGGDNTVASASSGVSGYIDATGGSETRPRNVALMFIIKT